MGLKVGAFQGLQCCEGERHSLTSALLRFLVTMATPKPGDIWITEILHLNVSRYLLIFRHQYCMGQSQGVRMAETPRCRAD